MADDELLDVVGPDGSPTGVRKARSAVHRDGDWHVCFHLWVTTGDGVLLQRRARTKAAWPGRLDATAAGHLTTGEAVADGLREVEEELGVRYAMGDLRDLGVHRVDEPTRRGGRNRELQHVFAVRDARPLAEWTRFDRVELDGLVAVRSAEFATLVAGRPVDGRTWDGEREREVVIDPDELVPTPYLPDLVPALTA